MAEFRPVDIAGNFFAGRAMRDREQTNALARQSMQQNIEDRRESNALARRELDAEQKREAAKRIVTASQHALQQRNPKAFMEQNFPEIVALAGPTWAQSDDNMVKQKLQEAIAVYGTAAGMAPEQPKNETYTLSPGQKRFGADGKVLAEVAPNQNEGGPVNQQLITRPVGNGLVQDFAWNPRTNKRVPAGEPYRPVTPHTGNVTEGERKAAALGTRLEAAMQELGAVESVAPGASRPGFIERGLEAVGSEMGANAARSPERQRADNAQLDALDAALTLATGAAYTREQLQNLRKSYFPQIGDSDAAVQAKAKRFETIVKTARIAAGRAEPAIDQAVGNGGGNELTATNPQTGEKVVLRNGQWVPY